MKILFANPPWWVDLDYVQPTGKIKHFWTKGVRAGSRWPTQTVWSSPIIIDLKINLIIHIF